MARNGSGTYALPAGNPIVANSTASSTTMNTTLTDIGSALTQSVSKDGQTAMTGNLSMGSNKVTGLAAGTAATDGTNVSQVQAGAYSWLTGVSGTDTITATGQPVMTGYTTGNTFRFIVANTNTGAATPGTAASTRNADPSATN